MRYVVLVLVMLFLVGCTASVADVKQEENIGDTVRVRGEVISSVKIGGLSGYVLEDDNGDRISVSSDDLPREGDVVTAKGTLIKDTLFGYYIKVD